jgi:DNA-binding YbaB/EbfC family protein
MFEKIGQFASLLKNLPKIREEMEKLQGRLGQITAEGDAGGGMVKARVNGNMEVQGCTLSDEALKLDDKEFLEDLIVGAVNQALQKSSPASGRGNDEGRCGAGNAARNESSRRGMNPQGEG